MKPITAFALVAIIVTVATGSYFVGNHFGYQHGFAVAYTTEHSHYLFEKNRADRFKSRITGNKRCIDKMVSSMKPITSSGLEAFAEVMMRFGQLYHGTLKCNQDAGFGYVTQQQFQRLIPSSENG